MKHGKKTLAIIKAIEDGAETSREIADELRMPIRNVSATLSNLCTTGAIKNNGLFWRKEDDKHLGPVSNRGQVIGCRGIQRGQWYIRYGVS